MRSRLIAIVATALIGGPALGIGADVRYVDHNAEPGADGLTWGTAYRYVQDALADASGPGIVSEIRVAQGTYRPDRGAGQVGGDRESTFRMMSGVAIRGGYLGQMAGAGEDPDTRDITAYRTILSGDLQGDDGPDFTGATENAYQVVTAFEVDDMAVLDGVTVSGGYADGPHFGASPDSREQGSGVNVYDATPILVDCTFSGNWAFNHGAVNDHGDTTLIRCVFENNYSMTLGPALYMHHHANTSAVSCTFRGNRSEGEGGGVYTRSMASPMVTDCLFEGNDAFKGGGMYVGENGTVIVSGCTFIGNTADDRGGGIYNDHAASTIQDCAFTENRVDFGGGGGGGGGIWNESGSPTLVRCTFTRNTANERGGGVYSGTHSTARIIECDFIENTCTEDGGGMSNAESDTLVVNCTFIGNVAGNGVLNVGGGMSNYLSSPTVVGCVFKENRAEIGPNQGGGGGMYNEAGCPTVVHCQFIDNVAAGDFFAAGGGMYSFQEACPRVHGCLFVGNQVTGDGYIIGGGMYNDFQSDAVISNCAFIDNSATLWGGGLISFFSTPRVTNTILWNNAPDQIRDDGDGGSVVSYCNVQGGWDGLGVQNIALDPQFVDALGRDFRLAAGSPCIDRGHVWAVLPDVADGDDDGDHDELGPTDLVGAPRFVDDPDALDLGCGPVPHVDLGPYETPHGAAAPMRRGDVDGNGAIDFVDLTTVLAAWGPCTDDCCVADFDMSGQVDFTDMLTVIANWTS